MLQRKKKTVYNIVLSHPLLNLPKTSTHHKWTDPDPVRSGLCSWGDGREKAMRHRSTCISCIVTCYWGGVQAFWKIETKCWRNAGTTGLGHWHLPFKQKRSYILRRVSWFWIQKPRHIKPTESRFLAIALKREGGALAISILRMSKIFEWNQSPIQSTDRFSAKRGAVQQTSTNINKQCWYKSFRMVEGWLEPWVLFGDQKKLKES